MTVSIDVPYQADGKSLARASVAALLGGTAILVLFVLPAEFGIDLTGVGRALGLTKLSQPVEEIGPAPEIAPAANDAVITVPPQTRESISKTTPYRTDERTLTLAPHSGVELKAEMQTGDQVSFTWTSSGPVSMDMHGERSLNAEEFSTYWKQKGLTTAQGSFTAPFAGVHGWYWRNQGNAPVTLTLKTSGFYRQLIQPPAQ
jgi:hypothetical protein